MERRLGRQLKVLLATGLYPPEIGGPATHTVFLESHLPKSDYDLQVVPFSSVSHLPKIVKHMVYAWRLWRHAKTTDIVYALDPVSVGLPAMLAAKLSRKPFVVRLGGDYAWEQATQYYSVTEPPHEYVEKTKGIPLKIKILRKIQTWVVQQAQPVTTQSEYLKNVIAKWGIATEKIQVVNNPFSWPKVEHVGHDTDEIRILTAGRLIPLKQMGGVVEAVRMLAEDYPQVRLRIAGDGELREILQEQITQHHLENTVTLLGRLSQEELRREFLTDDIFVLNSIHETFPNIVLEAMSAGIAVVATAVGGTVEVIEDGKSGKLVPAQDPEALAASLKQLIVDKDLRRRLVAGGGSMIDRFATDRLISEWTNIFRSVANKVNKG